MNKKEKYLAEIESRMQVFNSTMEEIAVKQKMRKLSSPDPDMKAIRQNHDKAIQEINNLRAAEGSEWEENKTLVEQMVGDIDQNLRRALARYK